MLNRSVEGFYCRWYSYTGGVVTGTSGVTTFTFPAVGKQQMISLKMLQYLLHGHSLRWSLLQPNRHTFTCFIFLSVGLTTPPSVFITPPSNLGMV